jgi:hypothetical protein
MSSSRIAGRKALGNFFRAMQPERAHWYSIIMSNQVTGCDNNNHYSAFPPLSKTIFYTRRHIKAGTCPLWTSDVLEKCWVFAIVKGMAILYH